MQAGYSGFQTSLPGRSTPPQPTAGTFPGAVDDGQDLAIRAERKMQIDAVESSRTDARADLVSAGEVPQPDAPVLCSGSQEVAQRAEGHHHPAIADPFVSDVRGHKQSVELPPGGDVPEPDHPVTACG